MAHFQQLRFVELAARQITSDWTGLSVLEIGAYSVNGSVRPFFQGSHYVGVDLVAGADVDLIASGDTVALPDASVDLAISCECFEHNPLWLETFINMHRMTKAGGIVLVTCASRGRLEHGTARTTPHESPGTTSVGWNYYRNLNRSDFERHLNLDEMFGVHAFFRNEVSKDLYFVGRKRGDAASRLTLDIGVLNVELNAINNLVVADERFRVKRLLRNIVDLPLTWAERLPDRMFQAFARRWPDWEKAIRKVILRTRG